jgi:hypothetical protein
LGEEAECARGSPRVWNRDYIYLYQRWLQSQPLLQIVFQRQLALLAASKNTGRLVMPKLITREDVVLKLQGMGLVI